MGISSQVFAPKALKLCDSIALPPANTYDVYALYGMTLEALGDSNGAIKWYKQALIIAPNLSDVSGKLANLLAKNGNKDEAIELLEKYDATEVQKGKTPKFQGQILIIKEGGV